MKTLVTFGPLVLLVIVMYFLLIRPQKKREKEVNAMRGNLQVGDEIITIGGLCGKIVKTKEESIVIQVGADKLKFEMMKWSVSKVVNAVEKPNTSTAETEEEPKKSLPKRMKPVSSESKDEDETSTEDKE